jgi:hypothetical protein
MACAAKSSARTPDNVPPKLPIGVRTPSIINTSFDIVSISQLKITILRVFNTLKKRAHKIEKMP